MGAARADDLVVAYVLKTENGEVDVELKTLIHRFLDPGNH
jgi:hypothetical protein